MDIGTWVESYGLTGLFVITIYWALRVADIRLEFEIRKHGRTRPEPPPVRGPEPRRPPAVDRRSRSRRQQEA